jgi:hypothetical protein
MLRLFFYNVVPCPSGVGIDVVRGLGQSGGWKTGGEKRMATIPAKAPVLHEASGPRTIL